MYLLLVIKTLITLAGSPAYVLVPEGKPATSLTHLQESATNVKYPAVMVLHDHGAYYAIGKEKSVSPLVPDARAEKWVNRLYDGMYVADSLAALGYVVVVHDCPGWGENTTECDATEWPQAIVESDRDVFNCVCRMPMVDSTRIYVTGFSMGGYRAWMLAAAEPRVAGCAAFHWMQSMPCTKDWCLPADYVSIASTIAPRPFMLVMGTRDRLFPIVDARECAARIQTAYLHARSMNFEYVERNDIHHFGDDAWEILKAWLLL